MAWTPAGARGSPTESRTVVRQQPAIAASAPEHERLAGPAPVFRATASGGQSVFGNLLALREVADETGRRLGLSLAHAEEVARALRGSLLRFATDPAPAVLSGHEPEGRRLERPHAAFLPLPDPGESRATIAGVAIALPRDVEEVERQAILLAASRWERRGARLLLGRLGSMQLARATDPASEELLGLPSLSGPSRRWASITPVALQRNPGDLTARNPAIAARSARRAEEIVSRGCAHICLPTPSRVRVMRRSLFPGVPSAPDFMPYPRPGPGRPSSPERLQRVCVHVEVEFAEPVEGPVLLGAGRYFGVGVCGAYGER